VRAATDQVGLDENLAVPLAPGLPCLPVALPVDAHRCQLRAPLPPPSTAWRRLAVTAATTVDDHLAAAAAEAEAGREAATAAAAAAATDADRLGGTVLCAQARHIAAEIPFHGSGGGGGGGDGGAGGGEKRRRASPATMPPAG